MKISFRHLQLFTVCKDRAPASGLNRSWVFNNKIEKISLQKFLFLAETGLGRFQFGANGGRGARYLTHFHPAIPFGRRHSLHFCARFLQTTSSSVKPLSTRKKE
ncbi:hypothetical protein JTE90_000776 [Oedothorax gibbosus]|uniref:Uncharacterized protein n=1 Tax=Oedothorax gibbosus TaxID=931172 RepID=A0AAV6UBL9_9ARAC|nr:hypothetical protein JTE90_000776 [Oedothorax gibbosus]